jgi:DNA modification methylase
MRLTTGNKSNAELNKLQPSDRPVHDWYRFVLSFPPHLVREYLQRFGLDHSKQVLDPFCGTGTTLVECKKKGIPSIGIEANPMAHFASRVKTDWQLEPKGLMCHAEQLAEKVLSVLKDDGIDDDCLPLLRSGKTNRPNGCLKLRTLPPEHEKLILANSISPLPLHKTLCLLESLNAEKTERYVDHERLALAKAIVYSISNLHFGPEVGLGSIKEDAPVIDSWLTNVRAMSDDLRKLHGTAVVPCKVHLADARNLSELLEPRSIDAVITSPPYPNEKDYTRTTRLESILLGLIRTKADLRALKKTLVRSNTRGVYKSDTDDQLVGSHPEIQRIANAIEARRIQMQKTSGFERMYARVTKLYFGGMMRHLSELRSVLRPGAQMAYVVGDQASYLRIMIRTGQLLADIASSLGYEVIGIDLFRTRIATATKEQLREEVVLLRWPGT